MSNETTRRYTLRQSAWHLHFTGHITNLITTVQLAEYYMHYAGAGDLRYEFMQEQRKAHLALAEWVMTHPYPEEE